MSLEGVFSTVDGLRSVASVDAAFGKPQEIGGKVLIPVAVVGSGFGLGFSQGISGEHTEEEPVPAEGEGGRSLAGATARPIAVIEVTPEQTTIRPIVDETKVALAGVALGAWSVFWVMATLRSIFRGRDQA
jgi:uncharacterized spore protein YtfJ